MKSKKQKNTFNNVENKISYIVLDFDGVLTDNKVYLDQNGVEFVQCSRADGLAIDVLKKLKYNVFIVSTEKNSVVSVRGNKLEVPVVQGVENKKSKLLEMKTKNQIDLNETMYVGNDLNDYNAMTICRSKCCPADSHPKIKEISDIVLTTKGGNGVVREIVEKVFKIDLLKYIQ
jgi:3-deoxy-D-manno-octulosonate 8-phosphate phosphatase (KDO 8-P phosphatase)